MSNDLISRHVFLFPFKWEVAQSASSRSFVSFSDLNQFEQVMFGSGLNVQQDVMWSRSTFSLNSQERYNEYNYFYDFVREILYDLDESLNVKRSQTESMLRHYEWGEAQHHSLFYYITIKHGLPGQTKTYRLEVDDVMLNAYNTGVGVLVFFLANRDESQADPDDILAINQFGRRIFPPFYNLSSNVIGAKQDAPFSSAYLFDALAGTQQRELAASIGIGDASGPHAKWTEDFAQYASQEHFQHGPFRLPAFIAGLFPQAELFTQENQWERQSQGLLVRPVLDDRMFVICWYGGLGQIKALDRAAQMEKLNQDENHDPVEAKVQAPDLMLAHTKAGQLWYQLIFVDGGGRSTSNDELAQHQLEHHTYRRWLPYTYFGVSRYSFICLTDSLPTLRQNGVSFLVQHLETLYYKMAELSLVQRATVLRFADEVTHLSHFTQSAGQETSMTFLSEQIRELYKNYIRFVNKVFFREVTHQEQGIELYQMMQDQMRVAPQVADLDQEINELHAYASMLEEKRRNDRLERITILGAVLLLPSFVSGFLGMNIFNDSLQPFAPWALLAMLGSLLSTVLLTWGTLRAYFRSSQAASAQSRRKYTALAWVFGLLLGLLLLATLIAPYWLRRPPAPKEEAVTQPFSFSPADSVVAPDAASIPFSPDTSAN